VSDLSGRRRLSPASDSHHVQAFILERSEWSAEMTSSVVSKRNATSSFIADESLPIAEARRSEALPLRD
jgi:hypothetical protein